MICSQAGGEDVRTKEVGCIFKLWFYLPHWVFLTESWSVKADAYKTE